MRSLGDTKQGTNIAIPATKAAEAKHGADWFWWFGDKSTGVGFRVQAKKLFPSGRYESLLKKKGDPYGQLKALVTNANKVNQITLYCFYNFNFGWRFAKCTRHCRHKYRAPSYWGCAVALPEDVQRENSDLFSDLQGYMLPWHLLVCTSAKKSLADAVRNAGTMLAAPKPTRKLDDGTLRAGRGRLDVEFAKRTTPQDVREIMEIQERRRPTAARFVTRQEIDARAQSLLNEQDLAGVAIFNDTRSI